MQDAQNSAESFSTLRQIIALNGKRYAIRNAFLVKNKDSEITRITYKRLAADVSFLGTALHETLGLYGQKIALCGKNCYQWCAAYLAVCGGAGAVVPLDREAPDGEILNIINLAEIKAVIADKKVTARLLEIFDRLPDGLQIISLEDCGDSRVQSFDSLVSAGKALIENGCEAYAGLDPDPDRLAVLLFTSGTTGTAKGVMLSNRNICSDIIGTLDTVKVSRSDSTMCMLPLHHAYQMIVALTVLTVGGCVSFGDGLRHMTENLREYQPTVFVTVPLLLEKIHAKIISSLSEHGMPKTLTAGTAKAILAKIAGTEIKKLIFSKVHAVFGGKMRLIIGGGAMFNADVARDFDAFGLPVVIGYGLTECSPIALCNSSLDPRPDGVGKPIGGAEAKIVNPADDGIGEIAVKGPMVMLGYYNAPEETEKVMHDGWFYTGDLGYADEEMNFHITGRSKNVIVTKGGKNVYPEELEYYLNSDPVVLESLISGDSDGENGEQVTAQVVPDEQAIRLHLKKERLTKEDVHSAVHEAVRRINKMLPSYKSIRKFSVQEAEFDKTATQKVKRGSKLNKRKKDSESPVEQGGENAPE